MSPTWDERGPWLRVRVECYSGFKADERPVRFYLGDRALEVRKILDRWYGEDYEYFKLAAADGATYILRFDRPDDHWELIFFSTAHGNKGALS